MTEEEEGMPVATLGLSGAFDSLAATLRFPAQNRVLMTVSFVELFLLGYGLLCLLAPEKHLAFNAWLNRRRRKMWHEHRAYTTPDLRMERRWSQQTPANLWRLRITGIILLTANASG